MVRPYVRGKVPVVFVHGLWGHPRNWAGIIGALEADPFLSERYQALTFGYSGGARSPIRHINSGENFNPCDIDSMASTRFSLGSHDPCWPQHGRAALQDDGSGQRLEALGSHDPAAVREASRAGRRP